MDLPIQQAVISSPSEANNAPKKFPWIPMLLSFLIGILFTVSAFLAYQYFNKPAETTSDVSRPQAASTSDVSDAPSDSTSTWETYVDKSLNFSIHYPPDYQITNKPEIGWNGPAKDYITEFSLEINHPQNQNDFVLLLSKTDQDLNDYVNKFIEPNSISPKSITFNSNLALEYFGSYKNTPIQYLSIKTKGYIVSVGTSSVEDLTAFSMEAESKLYQILSTFKFTTSEKVSTKSFTNSQLNYTFSYPSTWKAVSELPHEFLRDSENGKMFLPNCVEDPVIQNINDPRQIIVFELFNKGSDGGYCWSSGTFFETDKWKKSDKLNWLGDYLVMISLKGNSKYHASAVLVNKETNTLLGEDALNQIQQTFKFTNN